MDKYLSDALGERGLKKMQKWQAKEIKDDMLVARMNKLFYIILRLLFHAKFGALHVHMFTNPLLEKIVCILDKLPLVRNMKCFILKSPVNIKCCKQSDQATYLMNSLKTS